MRFQTVVTEMRISVVSSTRLHNNTRLAPAQAIEIISKIPLWLLQEKDAELCSTVETISQFQIITSKSEPSFVSLFRKIPICLLRFGGELLLNKFMAAN
jgi:hypothetical protein